MQKNKSFNRKKIVMFLSIIVVLSAALIGRLVYLMIFKSDYYSEEAEKLHERERDIKAARGRIIDATGTILADNKTVCTISVIHSQITDKELVTEKLSETLNIDRDIIKKKVEKVSSIEKISSNVDKKTGDIIRNYGLNGVKVDEDYKRYYPFNELASKVLGFTGGDNQGIVGLEVKYDKYLEGTNGKILTLTDARGVEIENEAETRQEAIAGNDLHISMDYNIQMYAQQAATAALTQRNADSVSIIVMNPQNGEIMAMVNVPEFDLNAPFTLNVDYDKSVSDKEKQELLNQMWRNQCISDTYEPGSTFKIITTSAALELGVVSLDDTFSCPGYKMVEDRRIRCHKTTGHGAETFTQGIMNSCNPVFIEVGLRIGADKFYDYFKQFGLLSATNVDLPGEASTIMHKKEDIGLVELATMSFGQSFQITPMQMATTVSSLINGGIRVTPHLGVHVTDANGNIVKKFEYDTTTDIVSSETSKTLRYLLEKVVAEGSGKNAYIEGYRIGGKTATSQTLPRSANKYISSFIGFAPANDPQVLAMVIINNPQGTYYGGTIAAPVIKEIYQNILPYLGICNN